MGSLQRGPRSVSVYDNVEVGQRFGYWRVVGAMVRIPKIVRGRTRGYAVNFPCVCDCGTEKLVIAHQLTRGLSSSCGCHRRERASEANRKHGGSMDDPLYRVWATVKSRCYNPNTKAYQCYGGRGIGVCLEWRNDFAAFRAWAVSSGYRTGLSLDRKNVNEGYSPENCRWATQKMQGRNRTNNVIVSAFGETKSLVEWAEDPRCAVGYGTLNNRLHRGWHPEAAISEPPRRLLL